MNKFIVFLLFIFLFSCKENNKPTDGPTFGSIKFGIDETLSGFGTSEIDAFTTIYDRAHIQPIIQPEGDLVESFVNDSFKMMFATRRFLESEENYLKSLSIVPRTYLLGMDAIALIVNNENKDSLLTYEEAFHVFTGKINNWKQINPSSNFNDMKIVFDGPKSSTVRYILDLTKQTKLPANFYAEKNSKKVVEYVANNKNAIGIVALCWLTDMTYDQKDTLYRQINLGNIKNRVAKDNMYYPPYQGNLVDSTYPFRRNIYLLSREAKTGLASGFASYLTSDKGQKVMLKSGLAPNEIPARHMEINMPKSK